MLIKLIPVLMFSSELINPLFMAQTEYKEARESGFSCSQSIVCILCLCLHPLLHLLLQFFLFFSLHFSIKISASLPFILLFLSYSPNVFSVHEIFHSHSSPFFIYYVDLRMFASSSCGYFHLVIPHHLCVLIILLFSCKFPLIIFFNPFPFSFSSC